MNDIVYPMKVHAVKLEYRRLMLEKMPHGYFKTIKDKQYIFITKDPSMPYANSRHPRRISVTSKLGKQLTETINRFQAIKSEYDTLLNDWYSRYGVAPPRVNFPIIQYSDPHCMNNEYFNKQADKLGNYKTDNPTVSEFGELKSKNELMGADLLKDLGMPFKYETRLSFVETGEIINPDCLVNFYEIDRCAYLEILGMNDKFDYFVRTTRKIYDYSRDKYRPGREVIYVFLYDKSNFDKDYFVSEVLSAFNNMIPDSAIVWDVAKEAV